jgi:hypothetical protein
VRPACYRQLSIDAQRAGASGVGTWSFSDTGGSSAWSDFDGDRPDWAMVYEADGELISSRRWEAFKMGIRDFAALEFCERSLAKSPVMASECASHRKSLVPVAPSACGL